ncbi:ZN568 protein, partial [Eubucco bourcierii]|nr:ZN568 protein [Eubucco bourcierii]
CRDCGKSFSSSTALIRHWHLHTREKPYGCGLCGKSFARWSAFSLHLHTHPGKE